MTSAHRRNNCMERIKINGEWFLEEQEIREGIANAFKELLSEDTGWKADIGSLQLDQISQEEAEILERPFTEEEIQGALMEMNGDKAPGPDGFTLAFWKSCWEFVKLILILRLCLLSSVCVHVCFLFFFFSAKEKGSLGVPLDL